jgi:hypothetical protein
MNSDDDSNEELQVSKKKRKWYGRKGVTLIKRRVTGNKG